MCASPAPAAGQAPAPGITADEFLKFRDLFYRRTGMHFDESKRYFVDRRLLERIGATGSGDFRTYFTLLRYETTGAELQQLVNLMTVNETYFFREEYQFQSLVGHMLPEVAARKARHQRDLRIWSLPCSTGEEPYSLAIYLLEHWPAANHWDIELVGSDIDTRVLHAARRGVYGPRALQNVSDTLRARYFVASLGDHVQIRRELRESVEFTQVNLHDPGQMAEHGAFDVIFCRNLLIYLGERSRRQAAESLYDALVPGGFLCLGHSESMSRISSLFQVRKFPDAVVYQRPL